MDVDIIINPTAKIPKSKPNICNKRKINKTTIFATSIRVNYHHIRYALNEQLSAKYYALTITEQTSYGGLVPYSVKSTPLVSSDIRTRLYTGSFPSRTKAFYQAKDLLGNLINKRIPFTHFEIETGNIELNNQTTKNANKNPSSPDKRYYLEFRTFIPIALKATFKGSITTKTIDTNSNRGDVRILRFPMDYQFGTSGPDIKINGYPTEGELLAAWIKYGKHVQVQWRDKTISKFLSPILSNYKLKFITHKEFLQCRIYSDKNKKGGFDDLVNVSDLFAATIKEIEGDFKQGKFHKFWEQEYQNRILKCGKTWFDFLNEHGNDIIKGDKLVSAEYKQKIFFNYLQSLIFTGQFDKAEELIQKNITKKLKAGIIIEMKRLSDYNQQLKMEFHRHSRSKNWIRAQV